jgi:hypothetical protein
MEDTKIIEVYHHPRPEFKEANMIGGFSYYYEGLKEIRTMNLDGTHEVKFINMVKPPTNHRFYGVGCRSWWYQWNEV